VTSHGQRDSSATSYLGPKFIQRKNLQVLLYAQVTRLVQTGTTKGKADFRTIEFVDSRTKGQTRFCIRMTPVLTMTYVPIRTDSKTLITAKKEVILSAGVVGSPFILMHSGIGDAAELSSVGITPIVNLPSVGRNLSDQAVFGSAWTVNSNDTYETLIRDPVVAAAALKRWEANHTGPLADPGFNQAGWLRVQNGGDMFDKYGGDPSSGPKSAHFELIIGVRHHSSDSDFIFGSCWD
jgi:choline dehydrogenase-like flavoprotein